MKIICLEGCSGTGKTTQYHLLDSYYSRSQLRHLPVVEKNYEPFKTAVEEWHRTNGPTIPFTEGDVRGFAKARAETFDKNFSNLEGDVDFLLMDRFFYTSAVYQRNCGLSPEEILQINLSYGVPVPDLTFFLDGDSEQCFARAHFRNQQTGGKHLFSTSAAKTAEIREHYLNLMRGRKEMVVVNALESIEEVNEKIRRRIDSLFVNN
jgi:dTMP kinase